MAQIHSIPLQCFAFYVVLSPSSLREYNKTEKGSEKGDKVAKYME